jgi:hypothetical protein
MGKDPFHRRQYDFRRRSSTVDAITQVMKVADICKKKETDLCAGHLKCQKRD